MRLRATVAVRTPGGSTETTWQARSIERAFTIHGLAAKPSERASRSERTAGTIPRLDGNTACTTPDRALNDGSSRTSAPLAKPSLASNLAQRIRVGELAALFGLSKSHFTRTFKRTFGVSPCTYLLWRRIEVAQGLLLT